MKNQKPRDVHHLLKSAGHQGSAPAMLLPPLYCRVPDQEGPLLVERPRKVSQRRRHLRGSLKDGAKRLFDVLVLFVFPMKSSLLYFTLGITSSPGKEVCVNE